MRRQTSPFFLVGIIFSVVGAVFLAVGTWMALNLERILASPNISVEGDPRVIPAVFTAIGAIELVLGLCMAGSHIRRRRHDMALVRSGRFVWAEVTDVQYDWSVRINHEPALRVVLRELGGERQFHAGPLAATDWLLAAADCRARAKAYLGDADGDYFADLSTLTFPSES